MRLAGVGFLNNRIWVAHESGHQAGDGLKHHRYRYFAAVQHIVADRIFAYVDALGAVVVRDARIVALIPAAAEQQMVGMAELGGVALGEQRGRWVREDEHRCAGWGGEPDGCENPSSSSRHSLHTSGFITMPAPPPTGVSSTE